MTTSPMRRSAPVDVCAAPSVHVKIVWNVASRVLASTLDQPLEAKSPIRTPLTLSIDAQCSVSHFTLIAHAPDADQITICEHECPDLSIISSDRALHLSSEALTLTALRTDQEFEPVYIKTRLLEELGLNAGSYDRPTITLESV